MGAQHVEAEMDESGTHVLPSHLFLFLHMMEVVDLVNLIRKIPNIYTNSVFPIFQIDHRPKKH
jgi:hypothetical protein